MKSIYSCTFLDLEKYFLSNNDKSFRAVQIYDWLYKKRVTSFDEMSNIKKDVIEKLKSDFVLDDIKIIDKKIGKDVAKFLIELSDNQKVEAVLMFHEYGNSLCISTQVGCNMGFAFC